MALELTKEQLQGMIAEAVKAATGGLTPEQLAEKNKTEKQARDALDAERREHTASLLYSQPETKAYAKKYHFAIKNDAMKGVGLFVARFARALAAEKRFNISAETFAKEAWGDAEIAGLVAQQKALVAQSAAAGGILVPQQFAPEIIELLRAKSVMRQAGVRQLSMPNGNMTLRRQNGGGTAYYAGESSNITPSTQSLDQINAVAKKLTAITAVSNELLRSPDASADAFVRDDLAKVMGLRADLAMIRGDGTANTPKGVRYLTTSTNVFGRTQASGSGSTLAEVTLDGFKMQRYVADTDADISTGFWLMNPKIEYALKQYRDGNGNLAFLAEMVAGRWLGFPYHVTTQIPNNLGGGDEAELYFVVGSECIIFDKTDLVIDVSSEAAYHDGSSVVSAFSRDESVIRAISEHDFNMRHQGSAAVLTTVDWPT